MKQVVPWTGGVESLEARRMRAFRCLVRWARDAQAGSTRLLSEYADDEGLEPHFVFAALRDPDIQTRLLTDPTVASAKLLLLQVVGKLGKMLRTEEALSPQQVVQIGEFAGRISGTGKSDRPEGSRVSFVINLPPGLYSASRDVREAEASKAKSALEGFLE